MLANLATLVWTLQVKLIPVVHGSSAALINVVQELEVFLFGHLEITVTAAIFLLIVDVVHLDLALFFGIFHARLGFSISPRVEFELVLGVLLCVNPDLDAGASSQNTLVSLHIALVHLPHAFGVVEGRSSISDFTMIRVTLYIHQCFLNRWPCHPGAGAAALFLRPQRILFFDATRRHIVAAAEATLRTCLLLITAVAARRLSSLSFLVHDGRVLAVTNDHSLDHSLLGSRMQILHDEEIVCPCFDRLLDLLCLVG